MSNFAIEVENLSKKYQLGELERYYTFRDTLTNIVKAPFRKLLSNNKGSSPESRVTNTESSNPDYILSQVTYEKTITLRSKTLSSFLKDEHIDASEYDALVIDTQCSELLVLMGAITNIAELYLYKDRGSRLR